MFFLFLTGKFDSIVGLLPAPLIFKKNTQPFGFVLDRPKTNICYDFWKLHCALTFFGYLNSVGHLPATIIWQLTHINLIEFIFPLRTINVFLFLTGK